MSSVEDGRKSSVTRSNGSLFSRETTVEIKLLCSFPSTLATRVVTSLLVEWFPFSTTLGLVSMSQMGRDTSNTLGGAWIGDFEELGTTASSEMDVLVLPDFRRKRLLRLKFASSSLESESKKKIEEWLIHKNPMPGTSSLTLYYKSLKLTTAAG